MNRVASFPAARIADRSGPDLESDHERRLLEAIRAGDRAAAEELVERTYGAVYASLLRMCSDSDLASDLTQETFQKAWQALRSFDGRSQLFTWLYRIAYTTFLNHIRRPRKLTSLDAEGAPDVEDERAGADQLLSEKEEGEQLRAAVLQLPDDLRFTITAHFWGGLAVREIAAIEEITTVAIRKRLHRAFTILEALLEREEA